MGPLESAVAQKQDLPLEQAAIACAIPPTAGWNQLLDLQRLDAGRMQPVSGLVI